MKFSYSAVWDDTVQMLKSHGSLLLAIAGVFFLLPSLLVAYFAPATPSQVDPVGAMVSYYGDNWHWLALSSLINAVGAVAIYLLLFDGNGRTVGSAIGGALPIVPLYFLLSILVWMVIGAGLTLLLLPGIYLTGRLATSGTVMVAERRKNPIEAIAGSWRLTSGKGWAVAGLIIIVAIAGFILTFALTAILGSVFLILGGRDGVGGLLVLILNAALTSALYVVLIVLLAAIYRRLSARTSAEVFE